MVREPQPEPAEDPNTQSLVENLREVLRAGDPLDLLALVSTMQHIMESGSVIEGEAPDLGLVIGHDIAETTAALHVLSASSPMTIERGRQARPRLARGQCRRRRRAGPGQHEGR